MQGRSSIYSQTIGRTSNVQTFLLQTAILDRLLHHSTTLNIKGESYRLKEKRRAGLLDHPKPVDGDSETEPEQREVAMAVT